MTTENPIGIVAIIIGFIMPPIGFILAIVSLCVEEKKTIGLLAIVLTIVSFLFWTFINNWNYITGGVI